MFTLQHQLSPERAAGLRAHAGYGRSVMNRPQTVDWRFRTAAASPRSLSCAAIRVVPMARATYPLHALKFGLQPGAPGDSLRNAKRPFAPPAPTRHVDNLPHQRIFTHRASTLNVLDASRLSVLGKEPEQQRSAVTPRVELPRGYARPVERLHTGNDLRERPKQSRTVDFWQ